MSSSSLSDLSGEPDLERDAASTPEDVLVASRGGSWMGDFLAFEGIVVVFFESRTVSELFWTESAMTARAANAAAPGSMVVEEAMADRGFELGRNFGRETDICGEVFTTFPLSRTSGGRWTSFRGFLPPPGVVFRARGRSILVVGSIDRRFCIVRVEFT